VVTYLWRCGCTSRAFNYGRGSHFRDVVKKRGDTVEENDNGFLSFFLFSDFLFLYPPPSTFTPASPTQVDLALVSCGMAPEICTPVSARFYIRRRYGVATRELGKGSFGSVMEHRTFDGRVFAIKNGLDNSKETVETMLREFVFVLSLQPHQHVVKVFDLVKGPRSVHLCMESCTTTLWKLLRQNRHSVRNKLDRETRLCYWGQLLAGIEHLHQVGVAHRDLKMDNLLITEGGVLKIADFGSSTASVYCHGLVGSETLTAPECFTSVKYASLPVDVWAAGMILVYLLMDKFPWQSARSTDSHYYKYITPESASRKFVLPWVGSSEVENNGEVFNILSTMLDPAPSTRISVEQLVKCLEVQNIQMCSDENMVLSHDHRAQPT